MLTCRLCGTEFGQGATFCPRCRMPLSRPGRALAWTLGIVGIAGVCVLFGLALYRRVQEVRRTEPVAVAVAAPLEVSADRLQLDYAANEVAADQRYLGRLLRVTGAVKGIHRVLNEPYLLLKTTSEIYSVTAYFGMEWADRLARVTIGDRVAVRCIGAGEMMGPRLLECGFE